MSVRHTDLLGPRSARRKRSRWPNWRVVLLIFLALVLGGVLYVVAAFGIAIDRMTTPVPADVPPEVRPAVVQVGQRINVLVMGLDDGGIRTDTLLLASLDPESGKVGVIQIPRDTRARLAGKDRVEKINAAYAYGVGDKRFPPNLRALQTVEDLLDVQIHHTVVVDMDAFRKVIDEIGGVTVEIPFAMDYDDPFQNLSIHFQPGVQKLDGQKALEFVRWRHNNDGTGYVDGDLGRMRTQQEFLRTVLEQVLKPANLPKLPGLALTVAEYVETTMDAQLILGLASRAVSIDPADVEIVTLPGTDRYIYDSYYHAELSYFIPDEEETRKVVDRLIRGVDPEVAAQVRVEVAGSASDPRMEDLVNRLQLQGFDVTRKVGSDSPSGQIQVIAQEGSEEKAKLVGGSLISLGYEVVVLSQPASDETAVADVRVNLSSP